MSTFWHDVLDGVSDNVGVLDGVTVIVKVGVIVNSGTQYIQSNKSPLCIEFKVSIGFDRISDTYVTQTLRPFIVHWITEPIPVGMLEATT
jgi:hypothetical protein